LEKSVCQGKNLNNKNALERYLKEIDSSAGNVRRMVSVKATEPKT